MVTPVVTDQLNKKGKPIIAFENPRHNTQPDIPDEEEGVDIGQETAQAYAAKIAQAKTILWNGPMGILKTRVSLRARSL